MTESDFISQFIKRPFLNRLLLRSFRVTFAAFLMLSGAAVVVRCQEKADVKKEEVKREELKKDGYESRDTAVSRDSIKRTLPTGFELSLEDQHANDQAAARMRVLHAGEKKQGSVELKPTDQDTNNQAAIRMRAARRREEQGPVELKKPTEGHEGHAHAHDLHPHQQGTKQPCNQNMEKTLPTGLGPTCKDQDANDQAAARLRMMRKEQGPVELKEPKQDRAHDLPRQDQGTKQPEKQ
jgi:hypothetical protein